MLTLGALLKWWDISVLVALVFVGFLKFYQIFTGDVWAVVHHDTPELSNEDIVTMESALVLQSEALRPEDTVLVTGRVTT